MHHAVSAAEGVHTIHRLEATLTHCLSALCEGLLKGSTVRASSRASMLQVMCGAEAAVGDSGGSGTLLGKHAVE